MCGKIMTVLLIFVVLNCSMARYNGWLHYIVGVLSTCYKRKAATYFYPPGGTGLTLFSFRKSMQNRTDPSFFGTRTMGHEYGDNDGSITPKSNMS